PELNIQYADFAVWQRQWLEGEKLEEQLDYWKKQLADIPPVLELPTDKVRSGVPTLRSENQRIVFPDELAEKLRAYSKQEDVTLFMLLLAGFKTLLYRYTGQKDIVVGAPIAGRNHLEVESLIGFFVNTLVLHTE